MKDDFDKWEQRAKENTDKIMSKEQTPITAEEFLKDDDFETIRGLLKKWYYKAKELEAERKDLYTEEEVKAKVLEALEREKKLIKEKIIEAKQTILESIHRDLTYKRKYFADKDEWNQSDRFIQGRIRSLEDAKQIVRNYYPKGTTKQK